MDDDNSGADSYEGDLETLERGFALGEQLQEEGRMYDLVQELTSGAAMDDSDKITKLNLCVRHPKVALCGAVAHVGVCGHVGSRRCWKKQRQTSARSARRRIVAKVRGLRL